MAEWAARTEVVVVTVFDGDPSPAARALGAESRRTAGETWRCMNGTALRRTEDAAALDMLGCRRVSLNRPEAAFRLAASNRFEYEFLGDLFIDSDPAEWPAPGADLVTSLAQVLRHDDTLVVPLALGGHADHCLVHRASRALPLRRLYYAEFPYDEPGRPGRPVEHLTRLGLSLEPVDVPCGWAAWERAALRYRSQVLRMFGSASRFTDALSAYGCTDGSRARCRIWSTRAM